MALESTEHPDRRKLATVPCADVTRELAVPTGRFEPSLLSDHVASCPSCAAWSARSERLDQILDETRPDEPAGGFDALWARVRKALDAPAPAFEHTLAISGARLRRRRWVLAAAGLAQAAVLLVAALVLFNRVDLNSKNIGGQLAQNQQGKLPELANAPIATLDIDEGQLVLYQLDNHQVKLIELESVEFEPPNVVALLAVDELDMFNAMESMAQ
jgi:hypothetical protein